jgi:hypothetical protein
MMTETEGSLFPRLQSLAGPLLAAMASKPEMLDPMRQFFKRVRQGMLSDGLPPDRSWLILATLDGLKFWKIFGLLQPSKSELGDIRRLILQIIEMK